MNKANNILLYFTTIAFFMLSVEVSGRLPESPNVLLIDGQTGATYAMAKCDQWGNFTLVGVHPGDYLVRAEIDRSELEGLSPGSTVQADPSLIKCGVNGEKGKAVFRVDDHLFLMDFDLSQVRKTTFQPQYLLVDQERYKVVTISKVKIPEVSTLKGRLKPIGERYYQKLAADKSMEVYKP